MNDTVTMFKDTPFFTSWSPPALSRLYFWFDRRRVGTEEDIVKQGARASPPYRTSTCPRDPARPVDKVTDPARPFPWSLDP